MRNRNRLMSPDVKDRFFRAQAPLLTPVKRSPCNLSSKRSKVAEFALIGTLLFMTGCAGTGNSAVSATEGGRVIAPAEVELRSDMVRNLMSVVPQLLEPFNTTIQFNEVESSDVLPAVEELVKLGYGMQRVDADQGKYFLVISN